MLTPEQRAAVIEAFEQHSNAADATRSIEGVSSKDIRQVAREEAVALLREKRNAATVARVFRGLSHTTLVKLAHEESIALTESLAKGGGPHLSKQKQSEIAEAVKVDSNASRVARKIGGVSSRSVQRLAKRRDIPLTEGLATKFKSKISAETRASIVTALQKLPNAGAVARQFDGISETVVWRIARKEEIDLKAGKAVRKQPKLSSETEASIIAALRLNSNAKAVARQFEAASHTIVIRLAKKAGIDLVAGRTSGRGDRKASNPRKPRASLTDATDNPNTATGVAELSGLPSEEDAATSSTTPDTVDEKAIILPDTIDDTDHGPGEEGNLDATWPPLTPFAESRPTRRGHIGKNADAAVENLVRALERARLSGDKTRISSLVSATSSELLQEALAHIRASRAKLSIGPAG